MRTILAALIAASLVGGVAVAQDRSPQGSVEARLERIEQAITRLEKKLSERKDGGMMEGCRGMMGGGMMGGRGGSPNDRWRGSR